MSEPSLKEVQQWMKRRILPARRSLKSEPPVALNPQRGAPGTTRLSVYAGGYVARMREALAEPFEAVRHILGEYTFGELAHHYAAAYPSHEYNLSAAGRHFPEFIANDPLSRQLPFLPDLALLEWRLSEAFHAFAQPPIDSTKLAGLSIEQWAEARLRFQPSVKLLASAHPVRDLWQARAQAREEINLEVANRPQRVVLFREGYSVRCELLEPAPYLLLEQLQAGSPLGEACEAVTRQVSDQPPLREWFAQWMSWGLFSGVDCAARQSVIS